MRRLSGGDVVPDGGGPITWAGGDAACPAGGAWPTVGACGAWGTWAPGAVCGDGSVGDPGAPLVGAGRGLDGSWSRTSTSPSGRTITTRSSLIRWIRPPPIVSPTE